MPPTLTVRQVLDHEYRSATRVSPRPSHKRAAPVMAAQAVRPMGGGTPNRLAWAAIAAFLLDRVVCP